jgi:hypothetical protein
MFRIPNHRVLSSHGNDDRLTVVINGGRNSYFTFKDVLYEDVILKKVAEFLVFLAIPVSWCRRPIASGIVLKYSRSQEFENGAMRNSARDLLEFLAS